MMPYASAGAFRRALEDRLRNQSRQTGIALAWLRKMVAFERLIARLATDQPDLWALKGGLALQWRFPDRARTTKSMDLLLTASNQTPHEFLVRAAVHDLGDWFQYGVERPLRASEGQLPGGGTRFGVEARLADRVFEVFHVDVGWGDPVVEPLDCLTPPSSLAFAGIGPCRVPCYPLSQHLAEKAHAYARSHAGSESSRVKDLIDIDLIALTTSIRGPALCAALIATFRARDAGSLLPRLPAPPATWALPFKALGQSMNLGLDTLEQGFSLACSLFDPVLQGHVAGTWDPSTLRWREHS